MSKFIIALSKNGQYYFNLKAGNGEKILTSETYTTKQNCINGIASVKTNSQIDDRYKLWKSGETQFYFTLIASNGETIGKSEIYNSRSARDTGISSVKANAPIATTEENIGSLIRK